MIFTGPCDGVGARVKHDADIEMRRNRRHIRNVEELFSFCQDHFNNIEPVLITEEEHREYCEKIRPQFEHARPIRGSQKCHSFSSISGCPDQVKVKRFTDDKKSFTARVADLSN